MQLYINRIRSQVSYSLQHIATLLKSQLTTELIGQIQSVSQDSMIYHIWTYAHDPGCCLDYCHKDPAERYYYHAQILYLCHHPLSLQ